MPKIMMNRLHCKTPLILSTPISKERSFNVWLKLENCQPSGSFKLRGIGNACLNVSKPMV